MVRGADQAAGDIVHPVDDLAGAIFYQCDGEVRVLLGVGLFPRRKRRLSRFCRHLPEAVQHLRLFVQAVALAGKQRGDVIEALVDFIVGEGREGGLIGLF